VGNPLDCYYFGILKIFCGHNEIVLQYKQMYEVDEPNLTSIWVIKENKDHQTLLNKCIWTDSCTPWKTVTE